LTEVTPTLASIINILISKFHRKKVL
jgi:hypothetical protein